AALALGPGADVAGSREHPRVAQQRVAAVGRREPGGGALHAPQIAPQRGPPAAHPAQETLDDSDREELVARRVLEPDAVGQPIAQDPLEALRRLVHDLLRAGEARQLAHDPRDAELDVERVVRIALALRAHADSDL